jgi:hypothetical protein
MRDGTTDGFIVVRPPAPLGQAPRRCGLVTSGQRDHCPAAPRHKRLSDQVLLQYEDYGMALT